MQSIEAALQRFWTAAPAAVRGAAAAAVIAVLAIAAYSNSFHDAFHFDDFHQIVENPHIRNVSNIPRFFTKAGLSSSFAETDYYRPVTTASFALSYALGGLSVEGCHAFNLLLHVANAFLVYLITGLLLSGDVKTRTGLIPLAAALIFAVHPIQTGAVTYISGRAVLLAAFFSLSSFYAFVRFRQGTGPSSAVWCAAAPVLFLTGLLSKEPAAGILGVMAAYDLVMVPSARRRTGYWLYYVLFISAIALSLAAKSILTVPTPTGYSTAGYLMSEVRTLPLYVRLLLLPINQNNDYALGLTRSPDLKAVLAALLFLAALFGLFRARKKMPAVSFFGFWFIITLAPESSFFPLLDIAQEYRLYLPSVGFIATALLAADRAVRLPAARTAAPPAVAALFVLLTFSRNEVWATDRTLWSDAARKAPHSGRAARSLGSALVSEGRYAEAIPVLERARTMPDRANDPQRVRKLHQNLGWSYYMTGDYARAAGVFREMIDRMDCDPEPEYNLAVCLMEQGKDKEAIAHMETAIDKSLDNFDVRYNLALLYERTGRKPDAALQADKALRLAQNEDERADAEELIGRVAASKGR